jgi:hypothetical protein
VKKINRDDPLDDVMATAIFHSKETAGDAILEIINTTLADSGSAVRLIKLLSLNTQYVVITNTNARYVKLDIYSIGEKNGRRVYINCEIQLAQTMSITDRSILHLANILNRYAQDMSGTSTEEYVNGFPYLISVNLLDYIIPEQEQDVHRVIQNCFTDTGKTASDKVEIHHIQLPQLNRENFDAGRKLHLLVGALQKLRGELRETPENTDMITAIAEYERNNAGFKQLIERFNIARNTTDEEAESMVNSNTVHASILENYMTVEEIREQARQEEHDKWQEERDKWQEERDKWLQSIIKMKQAKLSDETIAEFFNLTIEQVRDIQA